MQSFTFGSDEGFEAVQEAMARYIVPRTNNRARNAFHTSFNLNDATGLLNALQFVMLHGAKEINESRAAGDEDSAQWMQATLDWVEAFYRDLASTVDVELI